MAKVYREAKADEKVLRLSMDAKAAVQIGKFSRGGSSRIEVHAEAYDFSDAPKVTPYGVYLPEEKELFIYLTTSKVTSDFIVDCLEDVWKELKERYPNVERLLLNLDNGQENSSRRTQFVHRLVDFVQEQEMEIELAHYPPYHSKYNPIERVWGVLEQHWNGSLLDSLHAIVEFCKSMTYQGITPTVKLVQEEYPTGVKLSAQQMKELEQHLERLPGLEKWFVSIPRRGTQTGQLF